MNQVLLVGKLKHIFEDVILLNVPRTYKNEDGIYESDEIPCKLSKTIHDNVVEYCKESDVIGVRGRIEMNGSDLVVNAEKITFLSSKTNVEGGE